MSLDKVALDKWITSNPYDDGFDEYCETVIEAFTEEFYDANDDDIIYDKEPFKTWFNNCFYKDIEPEQCAKIIERAFSIYCNPSE
jgi:hypothetical protein